MYISAVSEEGNIKAKILINKYFEISDDYWRGIGIIKDSGFKLKEKYAHFGIEGDFKEEFEIIPNGCRCRDVILGRINPVDCPLFSKVCTPLNAIGPCMVSSEGACGIWYRNRGD